MKTILNKLTLISLLFLTSSCDHHDTEFKKGDKVRIKHLDVVGVVESAPLPGGYFVFYKNTKGEIKSIKVEKQLVESSK